MNEASAVERHRLVGWLLVVAGILGVVTGVVPLGINAKRVVWDEWLWGSMDWALLSSAMGTCLGVQLLWAGSGWIKGRSWAEPVSWVYVLTGLTVNGCDMLIFAFRANPSPVRVVMMVADGVALAIPVVLGTWLVKRREGRS